MMGDITSEGDAQVTGIEGIVSRARKRERRALEEAAIDRLTGLQNQNQWLGARARVEQSDELWIGRFDINNLKWVNDVIGHDRGDLLIQQCASALLSECIRSGISGRMVFRTGGDEFTIAGPFAKVVEVCLVIDLRLDGAMASGIGFNEIVADAQMRKYKSPRRNKR